VENVFGCLDDISELTHRFLSDLEDAREMRDDITRCISLYEPFQNFIEVSHPRLERIRERCFSSQGNEYECYATYSQTILAKDHAEHLDKLLSNEQVQRYLAVSAPMLSQALESSPSMFRQSQIK
jgi:hypothetical protein